MNSFKTNKINQNKIYTIVNVGSYKVRVAICSFSFSGIKILGYGEKRQSRLDIVNNEINNLSGLCYTIEEALLKAEFESGEKTKNIIINPFFANSFYYSKTVSYKNTSISTELSNKDIFNIISNIENISLSSMSLQLEEKYGFSKDELKLILSNIFNLTIDGKKISSLYKEHGEDIKVKILNTFISKNNYEIIKNIADYLEKDIFKIIPEEYAITKLGNKNISEVFIDIGNSSTSISIKNKDSSLLGALRLDIGIGDLVKEISKNDSRSRCEIIKKLDRDDLFKDEKKNFLLMFSDILVEGLKEILQGSLCPESFILVGGGSNNFFIKDYLLQKDFNLLGVKMLKKIEFSSASIEEIRKIIGVEKILNASNINIISQIITTKNIVQSENDIMEKAIQKTQERFK
ncbi:MAG: hypothetical protein Q9M94_02485 [Candidatus Gracilibacteria bacterium]|nr:hypothetical protein [Candidatus Gracilibacteria bacterium]